MSLVNPYIGIPKCQDCGWKLYTDLTNNCSCMGENTPERELKYKIAFNRARELQTMSDSNLQTPEPEVIKLFPEPQADPEPQLCAPEEFPFTVDCGVIPWSKIPIAEISPLVWFKYDKFAGTDSTVFNISDGNGRTLFHCCEEEVAKFFVTAANLYVQAGMQTQTEV